MANSTNTNPIVIDTFSSDIELYNIGVKVKSIIFTSPNVDDTLTLEDLNGVECYRAKVKSADETILWNPSGGHWFSRGLRLDVSDGTYGAGAKLLLYVE